MLSCLSGILREYLKDRSLLYGALWNQRRMKIQLRVVQRSILGSDICNASYDSLLWLGMTHACEEQ